MTRALLRVGFLVPVLLAAATELQAYCTVEITSRVIAEAAYSALYNDEIDDGSVMLPASGSIPALSSFIDLSTNQRPPTFNKATSTLSYGPIKCEKFRVRLKYWVLLSGEVEGKAFSIATNDEHRLGGYTGRKKLQAALEQVTGRHTFTALKSHDKVTSLSEGTPRLFEVEPSTTKPWAKGSTIKLEVQWATEYALQAVSFVQQPTAAPLIGKEELKTLGNITYQADTGINRVTGARLAIGTGLPGKPEKFEWGTVWLPIGTQVRIDVGRVGYPTRRPINVSESNTRYILAKYRRPDGSTVGPQAGEDFKPSLALQLPTFKLIEPVRLVFEWRRQLLVRLGPIPQEAARSAPFVRWGHAKDNNVGFWENIYQGLGPNDTAERWLDHGVDVSIGSLAKAGGLELKGWHGAGGQFTQPSGRVPSTFLSRVEDLSAPAWQAQLGHLTWPASVTWEYGGFAFEIDVAIGTGFDPEVFNRSAGGKKQAGLDPPLKDTDGQEVSRENMPRDINTAIDPKLTVLEAPTGSSLDDSIVWDRVGRRLFPLRPGRYLAEFKGKAGVDVMDEPPAVFVELTAGFPGEVVPRSANYAYAKAPPSGKPCQVFHDTAWAGEAVGQAFSLAGKDCPHGDPFEAGALVVSRSIPAFPNKWTYRKTQGQPGGRQHNNTAHYRHIAGAPVNLEPPNPGPVRFSRMAYFRSNGFDEGETHLPDRSAASVNSGKFNNQTPGYSVLLFSREAPTVGSSPAASLFVRIVETRTPNADSDDWGLSGDLAVKGSAIVGRPLHSEYDQAKKGTGWVFGEVGRQQFNANLYDWESVTGQIFPVNQIPHDSDIVEDYIAVVWYENLAKETEFKDEPAIEWPWKPVLYLSEDIKWPSRCSKIKPTPPHLRPPLCLDGTLVISSQLGSAMPGNGLSEFPASKYSSVEIYHQPDRNAPGFNPNEEHAILANAVLKQKKELDDGGHAVLESRPADDRPAAAFALRNDLNNTSVSPKGYATDDYTSEPYVLVQYVDSAGKPGMAVYNIEETREEYPLTYPVIAGNPIQPPYPLAQVIGGSDVNDTRLGTGETEDGTYFKDGDKAQASFWIDPKGLPWAISGDTHLYAHFYYPLLDDFSAGTEAPGSAQKWLPGVTASGCIVKGDNGAGCVRFDARWPAVTPMLKAGETLIYAGGEYQSDNPTLSVSDKTVRTPGLPGLIGWQAGQILFDSRNPSMTEDFSGAGKTSARLVEPLKPLLVPLDHEQVKELNPGSPKVMVDRLVWRFPGLSASLQRRVYYDPLSEVGEGAVAGRLGIRGFVSGRQLGDKNLTADPDPVYLLEPNILSQRECAEIKSLFSESAWSTAVNGLCALTLDPNRVGGTAGAYLVGLETVDSLKKAAQERGHDYEAVRHDGGGRVPAPAFGPGLALVPNSDFLNPKGSQEAAYLTLVENAHPLDPELSPVGLHVIQVRPKDRYRGSLKVSLSPNAFDEKVVLTHTGDFGAKTEDLVYEFYYRDATPALTKLSPPPSLGWTRYTPAGNANANHVVLEGEPTLLLGDKLFFAHYRHKDGEFDSQWAGAGNSPQMANGKPKYIPQLAEGWVKRVMDAINPYEARYQDFYSHESPATYASMIRQAGGPYVGEVALNPAKNVIENVGLIQLYETLLTRAERLSIDLATPSDDSSILQALLLAATRVSDLYMLLGDEAYSDAVDPTIGIGSRNVDYGNLAPSLFAFRNQQASLLDEELALLRGTDFDKGTPVHNRLFWNFVKGQGEAAYASNYQLKDANDDGFINEVDGRLLFPQGHGDAWGHYLSASRAHYDLLQNPNFRWEAKSELYNLSDIVLKVDYLDELKFAQTAAAKARTGARITNLTHRSDYARYGSSSRTPLHDTAPNGRAFGIGDWAARSGQAAVFDWAVANALLPYEAKDGDTGRDKEGLDLLDRQSVTEIREISANHRAIQMELDRAASGRNPLGFEEGAVPFDIDPARLDRTSNTAATHFEQMFERAVQAGRNSLAAWDYANDVGRRLRQVGDSVEQAQDLALEQDLTYRDRLIDIFGLPYEGAIGPGQIYEPGYVGPDTLLYFYVDQVDVRAVDLPGVALPDVALPDVKSPGLRDSKSLGQETSITAYAQFAKYWNDSIATMKDHPAGSTLPGIKRLATEEGKFPQTRYDSVFDGTRQLTLELPVIHGAGPSLEAPDRWGRRLANGRLQQIHERHLVAEFELKRSIADYENLASSLVSSSEKLRKEVDYREGVADQKLTTKEFILAAKLVQKVAATTKKIVDTQKSVVETTLNGTIGGLPFIVGLSNDFLAPVRLTMATTGGALTAGLKNLSLAAEITDYSSQAAEALANIADTKIAIDREKAVAIAKKATELKTKFGQEPELRLNVFTKLKEVEQLSNLYVSTLQEGQRLLAEREAFNKRVARSTQENRYQDLTLRVSRNDALEKYSSSFELAVEYTHRAVQAYDYETSLPDHHPSSATRVLADLPSVRHLGLWEEGRPQVGRGGLGGIMVRLDEHFSALKGQLGFNNPQTEMGRVSLRSELLRIHGDDDEGWRAKLAQWKVDDLWTLPEFRQHCRPFAPESSGPQPGLVIPFSTVIEEGKNIFGELIGGGDHSFDPSRFATKIRSVGVWFSDYPSSELARTPRIYLVPVGTDRQALAPSPTLETKSWNVVDQRYAPPMALGAGDLSGPNWVPLVDSIGGLISTGRRHARFRAYPEPATETIDDEQLSWSSRLVGRSVWNTKWLLIIPGSTLHNNASLGLDRFIGGDQAVPGVSDIKLLFKTYSHSGD